MALRKPKRLSKVAKELNVGSTTIAEFLAEKDIQIDAGNPNTKIEKEWYELLLEKFQPDKLTKEKSNEVDLPSRRKKAQIYEKKNKPEKASSKEDLQEEILIKSNVIEEEKQEEKPEPAEDKKSETPEEAQKESEKKEDGLRVVGKIELEKDSKKAKEEKEEAPKEEAKEEEPEPEKQEKELEEKPKEEAEEKATKEPAKEEETQEKEEAEPETKERDKNALTQKGDIKLSGPKVLGTMDLTSFEKEKERKRQEKKEKRKKEQEKKKAEPVASSSDPSVSRSKKRRKRKRRVDIEKEVSTQGNDNKRKRRRAGEKEEVDEKAIQNQIKETLSRLQGKQGGSSRSKLRKKKREEASQKQTADQEAQAQEAKKIRVTEFITVNELANVLDVAVTDVITACMSLGLMVSINQRVDAETISVVADEFGYDVEFTEATMDEPTLEEEDNEKRMVDRAPIVTIMGHVDHGKTSLLDYIRKSNIIAGESGGITQHIGAYEVENDNGKKITFLDTPGHEAFTAMRARGAKVTDVAIIVVAADDSVMPQTKEAISHAQAAGVPIVFAINKIDKPNANPDNVRQQLADMDILVEEWGGKYQSQEISAKNGLNIDDLLEKVLLEAELLELKADPQKRATGTIVEASLDRGKGIVANLLVQKGVLHVGDPILAGANYGRVKAMFDERGQNVKEAGPSRPVQILGFDGAPTAGDTFYVTENESRAKEIALERKQLIREQGIRATKHITLDEIGRRRAIGNFQELNLLIKGDVDGSVEALSDSLQKLSTEEIEVKVIHKGVGQISESDVLLASASDAIIIGFQVRPSLNARKVAEKEQIDIRLYSVSYDAIEEVKAAMEGLLEPTVEEKIVGNVEIRETFKISKVGTIAGCMVLDGYIKRDSNIRLVREGVVIYSGELASLKRFKDDVTEVKSGYECGLNIKNFNDIKVGDIVEVYEEVEVKRTL